MAVAQSGLHRQEVLARPKCLPPEYKTDRRSVYWVEKAPLRGGPNGYTVVIATPRVLDLAKPKKAVSLWRLHRPDPVWQVSKGAMSTVASTRIIQLSNHKTPHTRYAFDHDPKWEVSKAALSSEPSSRLEQLAIPKKREEKNIFFQPYWGLGFPVSEKAMKYKATERIDDLANPKEYHKDFKNERPVQWAVSEGALKATPSVRLQQLARPRSRILVKDDDDPYIISPSAKRARPTPRLNELAMPVARKIRSKILLTKKS